MENTTQLREALEYVWDKMYVSDNTGDWVLASDFDENVVHAALASSPVQQAEPVAVEPWILDLYGWIDSTCPEGYADEAFRVAPEAVREATYSLANAAGNDARINDLSAKTAGTVGQEVATPSAGTKPLTDEDFIKVASSVCLTDKFGDVFMPVMKGTILKFARALLAATEKD